jgi:N-acetylglucosamine-6-sulfatase
MPSAIRSTLLLAAIVAAASLDPAPADAATRPNILFILVDDLRYNALGCTGHPFAKTPNIDRLAKEGAVFKNAFVTTPLCSPSRSSFLTGQYVHATGVRGNGDNAALSHRLVTFPRLLHDAGYATAYMGKWHMGADDSPRPGFDRWVSFKGQGAHVDPQINIDGKAQPVKGYMSDILSDHAVAFLAEKRDRPFCLYLAHKAVHGPFTPAERHKELYSDQPIDRTPGTRDTLEGKPVLRRMLPNAPTPGPGTGPADMAIRNQLRMVAAIDEGLGRILKTLEDTNQLDNTAIIFTSDNGFFWGEHGLGDKRAAYEEAIRIPFVMRYPKLIKPGSTFNQQVLNIDVAPTVLDLAGVAVPKAMHGQSLAPILKGGKDPRISCLYEYFAEQRFPRVPTWQAVRTDRFKYIHYPELQGMDELYDLQADPSELKNLINDPGADALLKEMKSELQRLLKETG